MLYRRDDNVQLITVETEKNGNKEYKSFSVDSGNTHICVLYLCSSIIYKIQSELPLLIFVVVIRPDS